MADELARQVDAVEITDKQRAAALALIEQEPHLGHALALRRAGVAGTKGQLTAYVADHPDLGDEIDQARGKLIRNELLRRAIDGLEKGIYHQGSLVATEIEYSDRLLEFVARMYLPEAQALRTGAVEITGPQGGPVQVEDRSASLADVARVLEAVGALAELSSGTPRRALPAAPDVLAEPR